MFRVTSSTIIMSISILLLLLFIPVQFLYCQTPDIFLGKLLNRSGQGGVLIRSSWNDVNKRLIRLGGEYFIIGPAVPRPPGQSFNWELTGNHLAFDNVDIAARTNTRQVSSLYVQRLGGNLLIQSSATQRSNVGIGTSSPTSKLHIKTPANATYPNFVTIESATSNRDAGVSLVVDGVGDTYIYSDASNNKSLNLHVGGGDRLVIMRDGKIGINKTNPQTHLDVNGVIRAKVLDLQGADISETFLTEEKVEIPKGSVLVIDADYPGQLKISDKAYDQCVVGVVSGAGDLQAGLKLTQENIKGTKVDVALAGRVYVQATTVNGEIRPGDFLTTSDIAGYAMKVTDYSKAQGTVIGKAMTSLLDKKGLVLILVSLQ